MEILHVDTGREWRGGQHQVLLLIEGLRRRGHHIELLVMRRSVLGDHAHAAGFRVHHAPGVLTRAGMARAIRALLRGGKFAVVHAHDAHALTAAWLARAHRVAALVASRRVAYALQSGTLGQARYRAVHRILAVSRFVAASVTASGIPPSQVKVVYDGVDLPEISTATERRDARAIWSIAEHEVLLGCVGYLLPEKGQEVLVRALEQVRAEDLRCKLLLAGDGPCRPALEKLASELGLPEHVIFAGMVPKVEDVYRALDVFLFPSLAEPLGSSLLDAMAYGLPAIGVASGGVPEVIDHGTNGLLAAEARADLFAREILGLLRLPEHAATMGAAGRGTISLRFTADRMVEETVAAYEEILQA